MIPRVPGVGVDSIVRGVPVEIIRKRATPEGKLAVAKEVLPLIQKVRDPLLQDEYLGRLADAANVDRAALGRQLRTMKTRPERLNSKLRAQGSEIVPSAERSSLYSLEEEILLLALLYPSAAIAGALESFTWREDRCRQAWAAVGTQIAGGALHLAEALSTLSEDLQGWLTPLAMAQREYKDPAEMLRRFRESWQRREETVELGRLCVEIDAMLEGRQPMDPQKVDVFNNLSRRLKGSPKEISVGEASIHGRNATS